MFTFYVFFFLHQTEGRSFSWNNAKRSVSGNMQTAHMAVRLKRLKAWRRSDLAVVRVGVLRDDVQSTEPGWKVCRAPVRIYNRNTDPSVRLLLSMLDWRPEPLCLSERRYGQVRVQVTSAWLCQFVCVCVCVCVWQVQSPLILDPTVVSINHHDNRVRQGWSRWDEALRFPTVCAFDCQGQSSVALPVFHTRTIFSCLPMSAD